VPKVKNEEIEQPAPASAEELGAMDWRFGDEGSSDDDGRPDGRMVDANKKSAVTP